MSTNFTLVVDDDNWVGIDGTDATCYPQVLTRIYRCSAEASTLNGADLRTEFEEEIGTDYETIDLKPGRKSKRMYIQTLAF